MLNDGLEVRDMVGHGYYIQWNNGRDSIMVSGCETPEEAYEKAIAFATQSGWTPPKWWQFWRWNDSRANRLADNGPQEGDKA